MAGRGKAVRRRYQARLNLHDGMGELWDWVMAVPEGSRAQALLFVANLGRLVQSQLTQGTGLPALASATATSPAAVAHTGAPAVTSLAGTLADGGARSASPDDQFTARLPATLEGWDMADFFDKTTPPARQGSEQGA